MAAFDVEAYQRARGSRALGAAVHYHEHTGSTMDDARAGADALGLDGCGDVYVAGEQSAGRGRQGRSWVSAARVGLYATFHLCPRDASRLPLLSVAGGLAAADAVTEASGLAVDLKWPNDVLAGGRKLAGVLAEARHGERIEVFLGFGINVRASLDLPPEVAAQATSIEAAGALPPSLETLLAALSSALERWLERAERDPDGLLDAWRSRLVTLGQRVRLATPSGVVVGDAVDVSPLGELVLRHDDGTTRPYAAGDVTGAGSSPST